MSTKKPPCGGCGRRFGRTGSRKQQDWDKLTPEQQAVLLERSSQMVQSRRIEPLVNFLEAAGTADRWAWGCTNDEVRCALVAAFKALRTFKSELRRKTRRLPA